jgi:hypothetical protein
MYLRMKLMLICVAGFSWTDVECSAFRTGKPDMYVCQSDLNHNLAGRKMLFVRFTEQAGIAYRP